MVGVVVLLGGTDLPLRDKVDFVDVLHHLAVDKQRETLFECLYFADG